MITVCGGDTTRILDQICTSNIQNLRSYAYLGFLAFFQVIKKTFFSCPLHGLCWKKENIQF